MRIKAQPSRVDFLMMCLQNHTDCATGRQVKIGIMRA